MKHVMLDLETLGLAPGSALLSMGAVEFELDGRTGKTAYANIDRRSCITAGLKSDPHTEEWWKRQSQAARDALLIDPKPLKTVVQSFHGWFVARGAACIWSHGAAFDTVLWEVAAKAVGETVPWKFFNVRDTRTIYDTFDFDVRDIVRDGTHHNALDDAIYQIKCVAAALRKGRVAAPESVFG